MEDLENLTDAALVGLAQAGNRHAFGQLIERYAQMVRHIAGSMVANEESARELVQEALLQAYLSLDHLRDAVRFKSWLYGIYTQCLSQLYSRTENRPVFVRCYHGRYVA
jgi:RNA polymerase sigma factor (sigma-70 family)